MEQVAKDIQSINPLGYRLRSNVRVTEKQGEVHLWLFYPLKNISLNRFWGPVMERLSKGSFIPIDDILAMSGNQSRERIEFFLKDLVCRGFLEQTGVAAMETLPGISIIIPVYNRPRDIKACLDSLLHLDYPADKLEIMVVDDASSDETPNMVSRYPVDMIRNKENYQAPYCRNRAAARARGDILAFIDSDCLADSAWLRELVPAFKDLKIAAVGGMVESYYQTRALDRYEQVRSSLKMGLRPIRSAGKNPFFYVPSCNLLVRKEVFMQTGGFDESLVVGEDVDLCWRIRNHGFHIEYQPAGRVFHKHRNRVGAFCRRRFDYGTSEPLLNRLYPWKVKQMFLAPLAALFWAAILLAVYFKSPWFLLFAGVILGGEAVIRFNTIKQNDFDIPLHMIGISVVRSYAGYFYHSCAFFSRYYLIWCIVLFPFLPWLAAILAGVHLLTGIVEYGLKKPQLNPVQFLIYFTLEQLSYQLGVWWQCLKEMSFKAINPRITRPRLKQHRESD